MTKGFVMMNRRLLPGIACGLTLAIALLTSSTAAAAPRIKNVSLRGLQAGGVTTLVIEGSQLGPDSRILLTAPMARHTIKPESNDTRLEVEIAIDPQVASGIYLLRAASAHGVSDAVALGVDNLAQIGFAPQIAAWNVALTGSLSGSEIRTTNFNGKQGQQIVVEVESRRLGADLNPSLHVYDARRTQLAWGQSMNSLSGDTRLVATLPADGVYTVELHDALYRGGNPGFFRLKIGDFRFANLVFPLGVEQGKNASLAFAGTNLPTDARGAATFAIGDGLSQQTQPAPWPAGVPLISGSRPAVAVSSHAEILEAASDKPQELSAAPVAVNGRLEKPREVDRYRLAVKPGEQLRFDVLARRAGSPVDGVLSIQNEQGAELAGADDRPGSTDPLLDFKVPDKVEAILIAIRDLEGRGGADFIYRIAVTPTGGPDFSLALVDENAQVPRDGATIVRVKATRAGYEGPIKLNFPHLPTSMSITLDEIPAGATEAFVTLSAPGLTPAQSLSTVLGSSTDAKLPLKRAALVPSNAVNSHQPWLRSDVAVAVTNPSQLGLVWDLFNSDARLTLGTVLPVKVRVARAGGLAGAVRLKLLTTQVTPRKKVKVNNQDREVDDVDRTIRFDSAPMIAADQTDVTANILIPADLPPIAYDLAIEAELVADGKKQVLASAITPARRMTTVVPISVELAAQGPIEVRAGVGPTGHVTGKVNRLGGFALPINVTVTGLPKGLSAPTFTVPADKAEFDFPIAFPYGTPQGDLPNVKVLATSQVDAKNANSVLRSPEVALAIKVVPGEKPPAEKPLAIFEDQAEFVANLTEGGGQATLSTDEKFSGAAAVKVTPDQRFNPAMPGLGLKIREKPGPGEYRYLQFAWKKQGGQAICLQLNHDGQWGPAGDKPGKFRYHAGPGGECFGASLALDSNLPTGFTLVTRDLFADFGEFTLSGIALSPVDGEFALYDHIYLGTAPADFELVKP